MGPGYGTLHHQFLCPKPTNDDGYSLRASQFGLAEVGGRKEARGRSLTDATSSVAAV